VRVVAVAEHRDINQVRRRRIHPDLAIDAREVDPLVKPAADSVIAGVGNEVWEVADVFRLGLAAFFGLLAANGQRSSGQKRQLYRGLIAAADASRDELQAMAAGLAEATEMGTERWRAEVAHYLPLMARVIVQTPTPRA
jgi:hypothetical protein